MYKEINKQIKHYSQKEYSFIMGNGTSAIYLALKASGLPKGSKIAVPNISCPDPVYALIWAGYKPIFIDINIDDYNMNIKSLENFLQKDKDIKAIIAIHLFGNACDIVAIQKLSKEYNCFLLEDCAQAFGNKIDEGKLGSFGDVSIFSFGNGKIIEVGHGGSIQTNKKELLKNIKLEYERLPKYDEKKISSLSKKHRTIYYKLYYLGIKYPKLNILNLVYIYFFKDYYLYKLDESFLKEIKQKFESFVSDKNRRVKLINSYIKSLKEIIEIPKLNNKENILSRLTIQIENAEVVSKIIRDDHIPSNTMYPMLVDRFQIFFDKNKYNNSYKLKDSMLNLWTNDINNKQINQTIDILKSRILDVK